MQQPWLDRLGDLVDEHQHGVGDALLELEPALLAQHVGEEVDERPVLLGVLEAEGSDRIDDHDLELVRDLGHEARDLLHQPLHARLRPCLEEGGDGEGGDGAVGVADHVLEVEVAGGDGEREGHRHPVECTHRGEAQRGLGRGEEELQHGDGRRELARRHVGQRADRTCGLEDDHLRPVPQAALQKLVVGSLLLAALRHHRDSVTDEEALGERRLELRLRESSNQLRDGELVGFLDAVQQRQRVVLHHLGALVLGGGVDLVDPALDHVRVGLHELGPRNQRRRRHERLLVHDRLLEVALDGREHRRVCDAAQNSDGVGAVQIVGAVHVLGQRGRDDDDAVGVRLQLLDHQVHQPP
mmetsp:Transcript_43966/g.103538  ORF Transcript_43966/g.103538 Transcript_43966/m.103538 type:complete len:355 (-) Transcript_43966:504-1568(-)